MWGLQNMYLKPSIALKLIIDIYAPSTQIPNKTLCTRTTMGFGFINFQQFYLKQVFNSQILLQRGLYQFLQHLQ